MSSSNNLPSDSFQPARSRKKRRRATPAVVKPVAFSTQLENVLAEIVDTEWIKECQNKVHGCLGTLGWDAPELLCLGLGSPMDSKNAAVQLALIVSVCDALHIPYEGVSFFDPQFSKEDIEGLIDMRFRVLSENKLGKYPLKSRTLLFMPHCGVELYENILRENWGVEASQRLLLLGNVLQDYATATPSRKFEQETPCLSRIWKFFACDPVASFDAYPTAFNSMGLQYVRGSSLPPDEDAMWRLPNPVPDRLTSGDIV